MKRFLANILFSFLAVVPAFSTEISTRDIYSHLLIKDYPSACDKGRIGLQQYPQHKALWEAYIKALAKAGEEQEMAQAWQRYIQLFPSQEQNRDLLEAMAWGVIEKGDRSASPLIRAVALIASFLAQDAKGVNIIHRNLSGSNSVLRGIAIELASNMRDAKLTDEVFRLFREEKVWAVRVEAIQAVGKMKIEAAKPYLEAIIADEKALAEEKASAMQSLVNLLEKADREEMSKLAKSDRAGLRLIACKAAAFLNLTEQADILIPLIDDHHSEVRVAALNALGIMRVKDPDILAVAEKHLNDPDTTAAITAAWYVTLQNPELGQKAFKRWLNHESRDVRITAAAALSSTGKYGLPLTLAAFQNTSDPYVRMNLAFGLIGQRLLTDEACSIFYLGLTQLGERWAMDDKSPFKSLIPSKLKQNELIPNYPEAVNQTTRLEILNILSIMKYPKAQEAIKSFLKEKTWGVSGMAAIMLLTEGDDTAVDLVKNLLNDSSSKVRIQAALILALWGSGEDAINVLQDSYAKADRDLKEKILEGIGRVGSPTSIPFLTDKLNDSHQTLRMIAACALLQCLYH